MIKLDGIFLTLLIFIPFILPFLSLFFGLRAKNRKTYLLLDILTQVVCILPIAILYLSIISSDDLGPGVLLIGFYLIFGLSYIMVAQTVSLITHLVLQKRQKTQKSHFVLLKKYLGILIAAVLFSILSSSFYQIFGSTIAMQLFLIAFFGSPIYLVSLIIELLSIKKSGL